MADTLAIRPSATEGIDLLDTIYARVELDTPAPNYERRTRAGSCGPGGSRLTQRRLVSWSIPLTLFITGSDGDTRAARRDAVLAQLEAAVAYELGDQDHSQYDGRPRYLLRAVGNQSPLDVWQILDYEVRFLRRRDDNRFLTLALDLVCYPGQRIPDGMDLTGITITTILGGMGRVVFGADGFPTQLGGL